MHTLSQIHFIGAPQVEAYAYAPDNDTYTLRIHDPTSHGAAVIINLLGRSEQQSFLASLQAAAAELQRRLDCPASFSPSQP